MNNNNFGSEFYYIMFILLSVIGLTLIFGCDESTLLFPNEIDREKLAARPADYSTPLGFNIVIEERALDGIDIDTLLLNIDTRAGLYCEKAFRPGLFNQCIDRLTSIKIAVVRDGKFECPFHCVAFICACSGEWSPTLNTIYLAFTDIGNDSNDCVPVDNGIVPLLEHEWGHATNVLEADHSNQEDVIDIICH